jgi:hypothetical protein
MLSTTIPLFPPFAKFSKGGKRGIFGFLCGLASWRDIGSVQQLKI